MLGKSLSVLLVSLLPSEGLRLDVKLVSASARTTAAALLPGEPLADRLLRQMSPMPWLWERGFHGF